MRRFVNVAKLCEWRKCEPSDDNKVTRFVIKAPASGLGNSLPIAETRGMYTLVSNVVSHHVAFVHLVESINWQLATGSCGTTLTNNPYEVSDACLNASHASRVSV